MSIGYSIDADNGITFVLWDGVVTAAEWLTHVRQLVADPKWPQSRHLSDLRSAHLDASIDKGALSEAAAIFGSHHMIDGFKAAIVAGASYERARMFEDAIARHGATVFAFNSLNPACRWLAIDMGHAEQAFASLRSSTTNAP